MLDLFRQECLRGWRAERGPMDVYIVVRESVRGEGDISLG